MTHYSQRLTMMLVITIIAVGIIITLATHSLVAANAFHNSTSLDPPVKLEFVRDPSEHLLLGHTEPDVIRVDDIFYMYYRNDSMPGASISAMNSTDGLAWNEIGKVLEKSPTGWDSAEVIAPSVLHDDDGKYYLYYEADDSSNIGARAIGVAVSNYGPAGPFVKYDGNPVLSSSEPWEGKIVGTPVIAKINGLYYLFYHGNIQSADRIGVAYSKVGPLGPWIKEANNPILDVGEPGDWDDSKVAPSSGYVLNSSLLVFYEGFDGINKTSQTSWRIGVAEGSIDPADGRISELKKHRLPVLDLGVNGTWDDNAVQLPSIIRNGTEIWMYYSGNDGKAFWLGRATTSATTEVFN